MLTRKEREMRQRKMDIINAGKKLFRLKDYEAVTMREIALKSEFTRRTLYSYFKSKLDLVTVIVLDSFSEMENILIREVNKKQTCYIKLVTYGIQQFNFYKKNPSYYKLLHYFDLAVHDAKNKLSPEVIDVLNNASTNVEDMLKTILADGVKDGTFREDLNIELAISYFAKSWYGIIHQYILHPQFPEEYVFKELEYLIGGLLR